MDAVNPICRWLLATGLFALGAGCATSPASGGAAARSQGPPDPVSPIAPAYPSRLAPPVASPGPIAGSPISPASADSADPKLQSAGYSSMTNVAKAAELAKDAVPQIKVVALVGLNGVVTDEEVIESVWQQVRELNSLEGYARREKEKELYAIMLRRAIERELVLDEMYTKLKKANKMGLVDEMKEDAGKMAESNLREIRKANGLDTEEKFQMWLRAQGLTEPVIRRQIERQGMAENYVRGMLKEKCRTPGLAEIRAYYDQHPNEFRTEDRVRWLDIFIPFSQFPTEQAARARAEEILRQAVAGTDFVELVKAQVPPQVAASRKNWDGIGTKKGEIPADVEPTVLSLQKGQMSGVVATPAGYHIVKIVERDYAGVRPFDAKVQSDVSKKIVDKCREVEYEKMIEDLWRRGTVRVLNQQHQ